MGSSGNPDYDGDGWDWPDDDERDEDDRCLHCGAEVDHYLGCPEDPDPDYEAEVAIYGEGGR